MASSYPVRRGEIYKFTLDPAVGSEQGGEKYCVVVQNDTGNRYSTTTIVCPITRKSHNKAELPTHMDIFPDEYNRLDEDSIILCEQIRVVSKDRILEYRGRLDKESLDKIDKYLMISMGIR